MDNDKYQKVCTEFDRLIQVHDPLHSDENRQRFRQAFDAYCVVESVDEDEWEEELFHRAGWGPKTQHNENRWIKWNECGF